MTCFVHIIGEYFNDDNDTNDSYCNRNDESDDENEE